MINTTLKFSKVELLIKDITSTKLLPSVTRLEFLNCGLNISGDYLMIIIDECDENKNIITSTGKIYSLKDIVSYKTHA
jgi:hypothetical protein